jgi:hypothetical protein
MSEIIAWSIVSFVCWCAGFVFGYVARGAEKEE